MFKKDNIIKKKEKRAYLFNKVALFFLLSVFSSLNSFAQCAMCRASLESEGNDTKSEALNDGIVYLMAFPYVLVVVVGFIVYRIYKSKKG